jgi:hypothetical protein
VQPVVKKATKKQADDSSSFDILVQNVPDPNKAVPAWIIAEEEYLLCDADVLDDSGWESNIGSSTRAGWVFKRLAMFSQTKKCWMSKIWEVKNPPTQPKSYVFREHELALLYKKYKYMDPSSVRDKADQQAMVRRQNLKAPSLWAFCGCDSRECHGNVFLAVSFCNLCSKR